MRPMLATKGDRVPAGPEWTHEVKWDGMRVLVDRRPDGTDPRPLRIWSRNENDVTVSFPELHALATTVDDALLDGEVVALGQGVPSFGALADRMHVRDVNRAVRLAEQVALGDEELYVSIDVDAAGGEALVRQASAVERAWLPADQIKTETIVEFDEQTEKVTAKKRVSFGSLVLEESQAALPGDEELAAALAVAASTRLDRVFPSDDRDVAGFRTRVQCLAQWMPDLGLPPLDDDQLRQLLPQLAAGRRSLPDLRRAPWLHALKSLFTWQQLQTIDREAPERIEVPSGSRVAVAYELGRPPVLAVRIQEVFGLHQTPRIAGGRVRVLLHLLAPNYRPQQVTDDLASFWTNTYAQVRKELRARYPKHAWPEDPWSAPPERRPQRRP